MKFLISAILFFISISTSAISLTTFVVDESNVLNDFQNSQLNDQLIRLWPAPQELNPDIKVKIEKMLKNSGYQYDKKTSSFIAKSFSSSSRGGSSSSPSGGGRSGGGGASSSW